jgi:hypothetical protein
MRGEVTTSRGSFPQLTLERRISRVRRRAQRWRPDTQRELELIERLAREERNARRAGDRRPDAGLRRHWR